MTTARIRESRQFSSGDKRRTWKDYGRNENMNSMENWEVMQQISAADTPAGQDYALRRCSFDPKSHLINLESDSNKKARLYLTVEWRVYWFQTWCQENGKSYLIEESPVESIQGTSFIQSSCTVYIDGEAAGHGIGGINLSGSKGGDYCIQSCATIAKGRALANAGFGSVFSSALDSENGADIPCDGGMGTDFFVFSPQWLGQPSDSSGSDSHGPNDAGICCDAVQSGITPGLSGSHGQGSNCSS